MSTTGTEKHCRLCLMLSKGGTKACYHLLLKRVEELSPVDHQPNPWTVQQFLESKKDAIKTSKLSKEKFDVLFPRHGATELTKWDLSLFCKVLTVYCNLKLLIRQDIEQLLRMRNNLCHMNEPSVTDVQFKDYLETIQVTVSRIMQDINNQMVKSEIDKDMDQLENGSLALNETLREMRTFYLMEFDMNKKLEHVIDVNETVLKKIEKLDDRLELIYSRPDLKDSSTLVAARNNFLLPGLDIFLDLKNVSEDEETKMSIVLEQLFEEVINGDNDFRCSIPAESYVRLRGAVKRTFQLFLSKGWRITHTKHACIQLHIRCTNFRSLAALFREQIHGHLDHQLTYLNEALNDCFNGKDLRLETTIYKDEFWNVIDKSISCVEEFLTKHNIDSVNPNDNEDITPDASRHTLSLLAENVRPESSESPEAMGNNELETCLQLLKTELKSEFHAPHLSIIANCSSIVDHESYNLFSDNKVEIPWGQEHRQTIRISDHQSSKVDKEKKESTKTLIDEKGEDVERIIKGLSLKEIEPMTGTRVKQKDHSGEEKEITGQAKMDVSPAIPMATSATDSIEASVETEGDLHKNALLAILNSMNAISVYYKLANLTLIRDKPISGELASAIEGVRDMDVSYIYDHIKSMTVAIIAIRDGLPVPNLIFKESFEGKFERLEKRIEQIIIRFKDTVQDLEIHLQFKVPTEQMKNQTKAGYNYLHHLQQLCKDEERLLKEWQRDLKDSVPLSKEETMQREEAEDADIKGDKKQFSGTQLVGDKKRLYDALGTSKMLAQDKIRPSEIHLRHAKDMALKEYDEKTQQALTEMLRPGPALLVESTDQTFDGQTSKSHYNILVSDQLFERDSKIVEDIEAFLSELTSPRETRIEDPKLHSKIEQASRVFLKQPSADELKRSLSLKLHKEKDRGESKPIIDYDEHIWTFSQLAIESQDKQIKTASLQQRGGRITFWCIQRIQDHFECITVQLKRIRLSLSRVYKSLNYIENENKNTIRKSLDLPTLTKEWFQVRRLAQDCKKSNDMMTKDKLYRYPIDYKRVELLRDILKELETKI